MSERIQDGNYVAIRRKKGEKLSDHINLSTDNWSIGSKKKLKVSMAHKMSKIFVGVLEMLDKEKESGSIDSATHARLRSRVLNLGNEQIRNMEAELDSRYNVEFLNYHIKFKVVGQD